METRFPLKYLRKNTINYERNQELLENFDTGGFFEDLLYMADDKNPKIEEHENYILEMQSYITEINSKILKILLINIITRYTQTYN